MTEIVEPIYKDSKEAAALLRLSVATLNRYRSQGKGPRYVKTPGYSGKILYRLDDLIAWIEGTDR